MSFLKKLTGKKSSSDMGEKGITRTLSMNSNMGTEGAVFLHGYLIVKVISARNIPDMENWYSKVINKKDVTDPFVDVKLGKTRLAKTAIIDNDLNPQWNETFKIEVCHKANVLEFDVRDKDHAYTEEIGKVEILTQHLLSGQIIEGFHDILKGNKINGQLQIFVQYRSMADIGESYEVPCYFPMHRGCKVTLYQDAHCPHNIPHLNMVQGPPGISTENASCWKDMYYSLIGANHLICITGWAVWTKLKLFRGAEAQEIYNGTLGDLLCRKADEGVQVRVMVWSEKSSGDWVGDEGMMGTHDMETYKYFKDKGNYNQNNNKVLCALTPRELDTKELTDTLQNQFGSAMYTHHQKSVIIDTECGYQPDGRRKLVAYVGGLDLTGGRYDNPYHPLFETLKTDHDGDYRNSNAKGTPPSVGPREPWHDIHAKVEGPVARDVLQNFVERWEKQARKEGSSPTMDDRLMRYVNPEAVSVVDSPDKEWNVQFFRSITSDSVVFDQEKARDEMLLSRKKGRLVEQSITQAYIQMIRNAQNFVYIENQYFMGSAYEWETDNQTLCNHTIPAEIVAKIVNKIHRRERFMAYIMIPMWPEGDPTSAPMQAILHWQKRTMEMMYREVGKALRGFTSEYPHGHLPTDYLLFLCPGKRELGGPHLDVLDPPAPGSLAETFRRTKRQMIYVHSKMIIVDDSYILVGSANINERSMSGTRDTEMAVGCWQPHYNAYNPYGEVHVFRMSLWAEHMRHWEGTFRFPGTLVCARKIKEMTDYNWELYNYDYYGRDENILPPGNMLTYPVKISPDGRMSNLEGFKSFPDYPSTAQVFGSKSAMIPEKITT